DNRLGLLGLGAVNPGLRLLALGASQLLLRAADLGQSGFFDRPALVVGGGGCCHFLPNLAGLLLLGLFRVGGVRLLARQACVAPVRDDLAPEGRAHSVPVLSREHVAEHPQKIR
ncbi:unnamed protein product, partial [Laminaria digitata]